ncbi:GNAT family N-acetyltransferase [Arcanobacterium ihumii]|uniref:GNAT family N-acetyltransferase n=1 Tax=Arcanobacterium ihumii TaxID=2138162 RepID=UPI000F530C22|nr:GNAT family N-acetyltransferase [Arcanobacterium ihumii]
MPLNEELYLRRATEADRTYLYRLNFLTETFGDEHGALDDDFDEWADYYVQDWVPEHGGIIAWIGNTPAGGIWMRWGDDERHGFGHAQKGIPEVALAVEGRYKGRGIGTKLLTAAIKLANEIGAPGVSLSVDPKNNRARRLYERLGFKHTGKTNHGHSIMIRDTTENS